MKQYLLYDGDGQLVAAGDTPEKTVNVRIVKLKMELADAQKQNMQTLITAYRDWNFATFGDEKPRTERIVEHIRSELEEVLADPSDLMEWVDVMLFAWQGALRAGHSPEAIVEGVKQKMAKNKGRRWSNDILPKDDA